MRSKVKVESLIQEVMTDLEMRGYKKATLDSHWVMYRRLQKYCAVIGADEYTEAVGQSFMEFVIAWNPKIGYISLLGYTDGIRKLNCTLSRTEWRRSGKRSDYAKSCYDSVIRDYEIYLTRAGKSDNNIRKLVRRTAEFLALVEELGCTKIKCITAEMILTGFNQATSKGCFRTNIGTFLQYAHNREMTESNLRHIIPTVVRHHSVPSVYSPEEVERLLNCIDRSTEVGKRNYAMILIAARLGFRASDIANLQFDNIKAGKVEITQIKNEQPLTLMLSDEVREAIRDYVDNGRPPSSSPHIFLNKGGYGAITSGNVSNSTRKIFKKSEIDSAGREVGPHSLRASLATALLSEGNSYHTIQKVLGQLDVQSTKYYAKADIEQLREYAISVPPPSGNFEKLLDGEVCV
jgi:site-specific recombinase XerD